MGGRIVIMGSGETAPTMVKVHRALIEQAGEGARAMLDTPFGFQANADDLTEKIREYFAESVGTTLEVARWRRRDESVAERERTARPPGACLVGLRRSGQPDRTHCASGRTRPVTRALVDVVGRGGTVVLGSAAAVTVGSHSVPVYEIYKVGEDPRWLAGLDLLGELTGIPAAVIPHFDNREGGRHDTRFCYLGEQRLEVMEAMLPSGVGVLGVDEHTAVVIDIGTGTATVYGAGGMTLRSGGASEFVPAGESIGLTDLAALLSGARHGQSRRLTCLPLPSHDAVATRTTFPFVPAPSPSRHVRRLPGSRPMLKEPWPRASTSRTRSTRGRPTRCRATTSTWPARPFGRCSSISRTRPYWGFGTPGSSWARSSKWHWPRGYGHVRRATSR